MTELGVLTTISQKRLRELEAKERAHDVYREACKAMRRRTAFIKRSTDTPYGDYVEGYCAAMQDFDTSILEADAARV